MKRLCLAAATAGLLAAGSAMAQDQPPPMPEEGPPQGQTETTTTTWTVNPQERTVIHDYIVKERVRQVPVQEDLEVGAPVPPGVELQPVPEQIYTSLPAARPYKYFDWEGRMVFVDPGTGRIVQIVD
jgi:Protein of unknown function (DUF1236)